MIKNIKLKQPTIETNKIMEGTENYLSYCFLTSYLLIIILLFFKVSKAELFLFVFIPSGLVVAGNIYSIKMIKQNIRKAEADNEIEQLTNIISLEPENADAYYLRGCAHKSLKAYVSAFHDFKNAEKSMLHLSDYFKNKLNKNFEECQAGVKNKRNA